MRPAPTPINRAALFVVAVFLVIAVFGCGRRGNEGKSASTEQPAERPAESKAATGETAKPPAEAGSSQPRATRTGPAHLVRLTEKGCVQFEPHWTTIGIGQSLTIHSELKSAVTIHVSPGAFDKSVYVLHAGASMSTGPARQPGSYSISTVPPACLGVPRGVQGSGPGVTVEDQR